MKKYFWLNKLFSNKWVWRSFHQNTYYEGVLEGSINTVKDKTNTNENRIHRKKRQLKGGKLHPTRRKKVKLNKIELKNNSEVILDSKNELQTRLDNENNKYNLKEQIRDIRKHGQTNPFIFYNNLKNDDEIDFGNFFLKIWKQHNLIRKRAKIRCYNRCR